MDIEHVRLGQKMYGLGRDTQIVPTLVCEVSLPEPEEDGSAFALRWEGLQGRTRSGMTFRVLDRGLDSICASFDEAHAAVDRKLSQLSADESVSVRVQREALAKLERRRADKEAERVRVESVDAFAETNCLLDYERESVSCKQADFPTKYFEPGTAVWITDTENWQLIEGWVTGVRFVPAWGWTHNGAYHCGDKVNLRADQLFLTKDKALSRMGKLFRQRYPGYLVRSRVPVVPQISRAQGLAQELENVERWFALEGYA